MFFYIKDFAQLLILIPTFFESAITSRKSEIILLILTLPRFMYIPLILV